MSSQKWNPKSNSVSGFRLSGNLSQLYDKKHNETEEFIKQLNEDPKKQTNNLKAKSLDKKIKSKSPVHGQSFFKLNTKSNAIVDEIPMEVIKKRSKTRLESLQDEEEKKRQFNLLDNEVERKANIMKDRKDMLKKYNIDLNEVMVGQSAASNNKIQQNEHTIQEEDPEGVVKPSTLFVQRDSPPDPFTTPTLFQTPLLPCFASQFFVNPQHMSPASSKVIKQGEGTWKIGKIKIRPGEKKAIIKIGEIEFQSEFVSSEGKAAAIKGNEMHKLQNWSGIWSSQPTDEDFN